MTEGAESTKINPEINNMIYSVLRATTGWGVVRSFFVGSGVSSFFLAVGHGLFLSPWSIAENEMENRIVRILWK